jgi:DNA-binding LytR/AlgR family response regulator
MLDEQAFTTDTASLEGELLEGASWTPMPPSVLVMTGDGGIEPLDTGGDNEVPSRLPAPMGATRSRSVSPSLGKADAEALSKGGAKKASVVVVNLEPAAAPMVAAPAQDAAKLVEAGMREKQLRRQLEQMQQSLREAIRTNQELQKIQVLKREAKEAIKTASQITLYSDTSESLTFNLPDLLFIEADDNYSTVMWKESGTLQKKLLRVNLKNLESQLDNSFTLRCHRSYIVNVNAISAISGNTNGYKLKINGSDFSIPVSRPKGKEIMEKISQLRNIMELS